MNRKFVVATLALAALAAAGSAWGQNVRWDADGTKTLTQDAWTLAGKQGDGLTKSSDFSSGQADTGTNGVWYINDGDGAKYMRMYRDPGGISTTQGLVMAKVKYVSGGSTAGTFGYSCASGNHSIVVGVRNGEVNIKDAQGNTTTYNGGTSVTVPGGTSSYRVYALRWYWWHDPEADEDFLRYDLWVSNGSDWSPNPADWTKLINMGAFNSISALIDQNGGTRSGLLLGSFGGASTLWQGKTDYITWSGKDGEQRPWHFAPTAAGLIDDATPIGDSIPDVMVPGITYTVGITMQNTGNSYWQSVGAYRLGAYGSSDPFAGGRQDMSDTASVGLGGSYTFVFDMKAPQTEGVVTTDWQMLREGIHWFGGVFTKQVTMYWGPDVPAAPTVLFPARGAVLGSNRPDVKWAGDPHDYYEVHISTTDNPDNPDGWDSGEVWLSATVTATNTAMSGVLTPQTNYYAFVRIHNGRGWGPWSAYGNRFYTDGQLVNDPYYVAGPVGGQWMHTMCFNPDRNEYLVAYYDLRGGPDDVRKVSYYRLDSTGTKIGGETTVIDDLHSGGPHVCYNRARQEYLISYGGYMSDNSTHLRLQRVNAITGAPIGGSMPIATTNFARSNVAYSPTSDRYLLTIEDSGRVEGLILDSTAAPIGSIFPIDNGTYAYSGSPLICYNSANDEFLVPWVVNNQVNWDGFAQRVRASDGALMGPNITIAATGASESPCGVAYDTDLNRYLVICDDGAPPSPWMQFISASGNLIGGHIPVGGGDFNGGMSSIAWNSQTKEFLATWAHGASESNFGRRVSQAGTPIAETFRTNGDVRGYGNWSPTPVYNSISNEFLICWFWQYDSVYVRRYKTFPMPASDTTPPGPVTTFTVTAADGQNSLAWTNPIDPDFIGTIISYKTTGGYPSNPNAGTIVGDFFKAPGTTDSFVHTGLTNGVTYYYSAFSHDYPNNGTAVQRNGTPADVTAPSPVTNFSAVAVGQEIHLSWTNPSDSDFQGTLIRFKNTTYPTSKTDGYYLCDRAAAPGSYDNYTHTGVGSACYYYSAFAHDEVPNHATRATAQACPDCLPDEWFEDTFDTFNNGNLGGQSGWTTTGAASAQVVSSGLPQERTGKAVLADTVPSGLSIGNQKVFTTKTSGYYYVSFDIAENAAGTTGQVIGYVSFYATDSATEIARLQVQKGRLLMDYSTGSAILTTGAVNSAWYHITIGFDMDSNKFDLWLDDQSRGTNLTWKGDGTNLSKIVITSDRNANLNPQSMWFDNFKLDRKPGTVSQVNDEGDWTPSGDKLRFSFVPFGCAVEYRYAIGLGSGQTQARDWTPCDLESDILAEGMSLTSGATYYVTVQVGTGHDTWGPSTANNGIKVAPPVEIQQAKGLTDGGPTEVKSLRNKLVSAVFSGNFYVQDPVGPFGIKIVSSESVSVGDSVEVCGLMRGAGAERYLDATGRPTFKTSPGPGGPYPLALGSRSIGGADLNVLAPGVVGGLGPNNVGLLVTVYGKVTQRQTSVPKYFYVDDGAGLRDGTLTGGAENVGIRIDADPADYDEGSYVAVTGISSFFDSGGLRPQVLPASVVLLKEP